MNNILRRLDLNLLVTLDVLLAEQNVTRAAERLHFSQPSVSVHLAKLRDIFDDPLLLPGPRGMRPTARAESLREPLREALASLERAVSPQAAFDPASADKTWRIAATDYTESTVLLPALSGLRAAAPRTRIAVLEIMPPRLAKQAENGEIDLAFHIASPETAGFHQQALFTESYVLVISFRCNRSRSRSTGPSCASSRRPSIFPATRCRCTGTNACIAIRRIGGCASSSRKLSESIADH
jgi:DNA-binding transcriptional LysR family regulator